MLGCHCDQAFEQRRPGSGRKGSLEVIINMLVGLLSKLECQYDAEEAPVAYGVEDENENENEDE